MPLDLQRQWPHSFIGCNYTIEKHDCTTATCCVAQSSFLYVPEYWPNLFYAILFGVFILPQVFLGVKYKTWGYMVGMVTGLAVEVIGYVGRVLLNDNWFNNDAFLMYLIALTIAPVFVTAAIYICLTRIIIMYGEHLSFFRPRTIAIAFMSSDFISLVLQAVGGAIAETADDGSDTKQTGVDIMIAGLLLQAISLVVFSAVWAHFHISLRRGIPDQTPDRRRARGRKIFKLFQAGLMLATAAIIVRSVYRVVELWGGFEGELWNNERDFIIMDGAMMGLAVVLLTGLHPGFCFQGHWQTTGWNVRGSRQKGAVGGKSAEEA
ncbi:unnamed protein product [Zymoseptoria tritici ST99CH_3D7]|uniref:RTA1 domain protein n=1 Tax=Zymoseptoria tritici (strain ST99CH_3D7) TaxID=1276538 RepID=A0A1X7RGP5_ZYMT9|nr:unnamed protein product [Zymoseptoria tritici ST99CH_3D7]